MPKVMDVMLENTHVSRKNKSLSPFKEAIVAKGVCVVRKFDEKPLYKPSAGKILIFDNERKEDDIVFRRPPKEQPAFKSEEGVVRNVFKK